MLAFLWILTAFLHVSDSWQGFVHALSPQICLPLLFSTTLPSFDYFREFNVRINQASFSWLFRLDPNWGTMWLFLFLPLFLIQILLTLLIVVQLGDTNSCWRPFPLSFVVTWLCQSECLMSGECELLAACEPHFVQ